MTYTTQYQARKAKQSNEVVVKVSGGYKLMDARDYKVWKAQK